MAVHSGQCHCGALKVEFETGKPFAPRACQCRFCRRHNVRMVSDPDGSAVLTLGPEARCYRFGTGTTDFVFCGRCGVYVGATADIGGATFAVLSLNALDDPHLDIVATPVFYDGESVEARADRRRHKWTPARIVQA